MFSEGSTLCARMARPDACQGTSWRARGAGSLRGLGCSTRWPSGGDGSIKLGRCFTGVRSPPLRDLVAARSQASREKAGDDAMGGFFRRDAVSASAWQGRTDSEACHDNPRAGERAGGLTGTTYWQNPGFPYGRAEPAPPRHRQPLVMGLAGESPEMAPRTVLSEERALRVRMARPDACQGTSWRTRGAGSLRHTGSLGKGALWEKA